MQTQMEMPTAESKPHLPPTYEEYYGSDAAPLNEDIDHEQTADIHIPYSRHPHKLFAYFIPLPKPQISNANRLPDRFLIYKPPPPPLLAPREGEKKPRMRKVQRKWQNEVRDAKNSNAKVMSWKGVGGRAIIGVNILMGWTTSSILDFLNRAPDPSTKKDKKKTEAAADASIIQSQQAVGLQEMVLIYPQSMPGSEMDVRREFVNSMLRTKSKAQRDTIIATGLLPVGFAIDMLLIVIWPFGGLLEIDAVWAYSSYRGATTAGSVIKGLRPDSHTDDRQVNLSFTPSSAAEILRRYLTAECHMRHPMMFKSEGPSPTESEILETIGWSPARLGSSESNEDVQWEIAEAKDDFRNTAANGANEWKKLCVDFEKNPEKVLKRDY